MAIKNKIDDSCCKDLYGNVNNDTPASIAKSVLNK